MIASASWPALGTTAAVFVTEARAIASARAMLEDELARIDVACSRFRPDSELSRANAAAGRPFGASALLLDAIAIALSVAEATDGAVDPTVGRAMRNLGYDRDFAEIPRDGSVRARRPAAASAWQRVIVDRGAGTVLVPEGVELDLGATAKALAADRAAHDIGLTLDCGVLVNLGGDIAIGGPVTDRGWGVRVCDDHANARSGRGETIAVSAGGLATSSTTVRNWSGGGSDHHHIVDPRTGRSAPVVWRTVSVAAASCVDANAASTASIVRGTSAPRWLTGLALPGRLVAADGSIVRVAGWPAAEDR